MCCLICRRNAQSVFIIFLTRKISRLQLAKFVCISNKLVLFAIRNLRYSIRVYLKCSYLFCSLTSVLLSKSVKGRTLVLQGFTSYRLICPFLFEVTNVEFLRAFYFVLKISSLLCQKFCLATVMNCCIFYRSMCA